MRAAYGVTGDLAESFSSKRKGLVRVNSRNSVRSNKSTHSATPVMGRYKSSGKHQPG